MIEAELKARLCDPDAVRHRLDELAVGAVEEYHDTYFDTASGELDADGREFARGLVNYSAQELNQIKGLHTSRIEKMLGYKAYEEIIHRDDLVVL